MKKRLMAAVLSTVMAATMLVTGSISVQAADAAAANDPAVELIFTHYVFLFPFFHVYL